MVFSFLRSAAAALVGTTVLSCLITVSSAEARPSAPREGAGIDVSRIAGADRYEVAANVASRLKRIPDPIVFLASGENFPDALAAGPNSQPFSAQLLLTTRDHIPPRVASEITSIHPAAIFIVGGINSISSTVAEELVALAPYAQLRRVDGADRYEVSRKLVEQTVFNVRPDMRPHVATGTNFPDALSAGASAARDGSPLLLVPGTSPSLDSATRSVLGTLHLREITVVGGEASVSAGIFKDLGAVGPVFRAGGADRYAASLSLNQHTFANATTAYLATGLAYPDALTGGVLAGQMSSPLYIVPSTCVPSGVLADLTRLGVEHVVLIGGPASLSDAVAHLTPCP